MASTMIDTQTLQVGEARVRLLAKDDRIVIGLRAGKKFEPDSLRVWGSLCRLGGTVMDVGAYTGVFTIAARILGSRSVAFEPMEANAVRLRLNAQINGVDAKVNVEAVSDVAGTAMFHYSATPLTSGGSLVSDKGYAAKVRTVTVDSLDMTRLDAVKIDVERAEYKVLAGAAATLERLRPMLLLEVLDDASAGRVLAAVPGYRRLEVLDGRNWLMEPI